VAVHGQSVGDLARSDAMPGGTSFRYRDGATASQAVSLIMPVRRDDYPWQRGLHPIFEMHLPEGILRERLTQMFSKAIHGFDDLHLLSIVGPHQLGRDAHMKNFSLLYDPAGEDSSVRLAPTYDIVTTTAYKPNDMMALLVRGNGRENARRLE
jgi:HipA-like protein